MDKKSVTLMGIAFVLVICILGISNREPWLTINIDTDEESTVMFNGKVVGANNAAIEVNKGINRIVVKNSEGMYWIGEWEAKQGTAEEFLQNVEASGDFFSEQRRTGSLDLKISF
ncbi:hypothetical protein PRVXT_002039 [Proteinivorax tanatarense]|uniref:PEGA domain-containing protein n=1 Tax=Proteinivorax tanatarense TaxID=1260629 RepID=A0AAU7VIT8_9FIRM